MQCKVSADPRPIVVVRDGLNTDLRKPNRDSPSPSCHNHNADRTTLRDTTSAWLRFRKSVTNVENLGETVGPKGNHRVRDTQDAHEELQRIPANAVETLLNVHAKT